jgi:hypothetical protein
MRHIFRQPLFVLLASDQAGVPHRFRILDLLDDLG